MAMTLSPDRAALTGTAVVMACACGVASNTARALQLGGVGATSQFVHPVFIGVGAALVIHGLWRVARAHGLTALAAFALIAVGALLTPPAVMTSAALPWNTTQMLGAAVYVVAAAMLWYAFFRAFPSPNPSAAGGAMAGAAVATGCGCCMVTGAVSGMFVTGGLGDMSMGALASGGMRPSTTLFWGGMVAIAVGLFRLGGWRALIWVPVGVVMLKYGPDALKVTGDWMVATVNLRSYAAYLVTLAGTGVIMNGFAVAYRIAGAATAGRVEAAVPGQLALGSAAGD